MAKRTGSADLPLHGGRVPPWLATRMACLGRVIVEAIVHHYGRDELLRRLAHPFWFQSFGAVMGMDWHSSGITTSVIGALKRGLGPVERELGIYVCGGRGRHSRRTPAELTSVGERTGVDADSLARTSRLVAKIDSAAVQDGFDLYLHAFIVTSAGDWCVVQQGMSDARGEARRYHWLSENLESFLDSPHAAIEGRSHGAIVNLADARAARSRSAGLDLVREGPDRTIRVLRRLREPANAAPSLFPELEPELAIEPAALEALPRLQMPAHHDVRASDVVLRRLHAALAAAADRGPEEFTDVLLTPGVGARTIGALALVAEVVHGTPCRFSDPARFSLAHGGKDGHPFPVPLRVYDETLGVLKNAVARAKLGNGERLSAIRRLDLEARRLERAASGPGFDEFIARERALSDHYGGRTVQSTRGDRGATKERDR
ncbi:MAG: DUF763 domain-containing protein [Gammaproteobacteria bacterium]|nr:DUF763 domain-containing protein [Gammaproteobacteria bacterium]